MKIKLTKVERKILEICKTPKTFSEIQEELRRRRDTRFWVFENGLPRLVRKT